MMYLINNNRTRLKDPAGAELKVVLPSRTYKFHVDPNKHAHTLH